MKRKELLIVILVNLIIAVGFFIENRGAGFTQLSSDLHNSIPVCLKLDDPSLFPGDLYLADIANVRYYTPFYIETIRFFAWCSDGDYLAGINVFSLLIHLIYGLSWFLLFHKIFGKFTIALFLSILIRGILWLPGSEIWGISDLWTMMPRTMYAALMPIPFIFLLQRAKTSFMAACFLIGFIFNFHPITGMGGLLMFALLTLSYPLLFSQKIPWKIVFVGALLLVVGMLPFLSTYFMQTKSSAVYDIELYKRAFASRIPAFFAEPGAFLRLWISAKMLLFAVPLCFYLAYGWLADRRHLRKAILLIAISLLTIIVFSASVYVENAVNATFGLNLRMSFQIIRAQKLAILPGFVAIGFLLVIASERIRSFDRVFAIALPVFILCLAVSKEAVFNKVPFFSDDIARSIFPDYRQIASSAEEKQLPLDRMLDYITLHTSKKDIFYGKYVVRSGCKRAVVLDEKGASMLIEGNPVALIDWYKEMRHLKTLTELQKLQYLKDVKSVSYILTEETLSGPVTLVHTEAENHLYKIQ
jgi:hypothetical protein